MIPDAIVAREAGTGHVLVLDRDRGLSQYPGSNLPALQVLLR